MTRQTALPPTLAPRLICREAAAADASVSPNIFDQVVDDGRMPKPRRLTVTPIAWDVRQLDIAIDLLPVEGDDTACDDGWSDDHAT